MRLNLDSVMPNSSLALAVTLLAGLAVSVVLAAAVLHLRDTIARSQGKTPEQVQARLSALLQFRSTLERCIPGVLVIVFSIFYVLDRARQHESDWWVGLLFIPLGWVLVPLLARKSWRRYLALQQMAERPVEKSRPGE